MYDSAAGVRKEAFWPTESQELLLKTALLRGPAGLEAWQTWRSKYDFLDHPHGHGAFRLFPMVYRRLVAEGIDEPLLPRLKGIYRYWWSANHRLFAVSAPLLDGLRQAGIRTMVLKGAAIAPLYYRDMGARPMSDVDVLVPLGQVGPAVELLGRLGWRAVTPSVTNDIRFRHSVEMRNGAGQEFDLHWHAFRECLRTDSDEDLWRSAVPTRIGEVPTLAPDATFALLHTVVHGIRWNPEPSIRWIPDSMAILGTAGADLDWERLLDQADRRRLRLQLGAGLRYLRETVGAPVPVSALERLRAARTSRTERLEYRCLSLGAEERERMFFGYLPFFLVEYLRWADGKNPVMKAVGLPWYMYYRVRSQPDFVPPAIRLRVRRARAAFLPGPGPARAAETRSAIAEGTATPPDKAPYREAWRYFESCSRGGLRRVLGYGAVAAAQSLLVLPVLLLIRHALDQSIPQGRVPDLVLIGAAIFGLRLVAGAAALWLRVVHIRLIKDAVSRLREDLLTRLYTLSRFHYTQRDRQTMQARIVQDSERLDNMSNQVASKFLPAVFSAAALLAVLGYLNWILLLSLLALAPILFLTARMTGRMVKGRVFVFQRAFERFSKGVSFVLQHMDLTRVQSYETEETQRRVADLEHLRDTGQEMAYSFALHGQVQTIVVTLSGIVILVVGGALVAAKSMTLGQFFSFWVAAGLLNGFIGTIANAIPDIIVGNESMVTLYRLAHTGERVPYQGRRRIPFAGRVRLESVEFGYGDSPILRGVDLEIAPGSNIAIIGPNGAGKSTILYLILGFYRPVKGRLLADEVPYEEIDLPDLRRGIGVVMQHPTFFAGTIREIITYGSLDATPDDMQRAARAALAEEFIQKLPAGYDTQVGEDALLLSGGEAQRLAIARALLRRPKVLVLDEPTNHLEIGAVDRLMVNLAEMENRPAIITISHDRQVLRHATSVFRLEDGRLRPQPTAAGSGAGAEVRG